MLSGGDVRYSYCVWVTCVLRVGDGDFDLRGDGVDGSDGLLSGDGFLDALGGDEVFAGND